METSLILPMRKHLRGGGGHDCGKWTLSIASAKASALCTGRQHSASKQTEEATLDISSDVHLYTRVTLGQEWCPTLEAAAAARSNSTVNIIGAKVAADYLAKRTSASGGATERDRRVLPGDNAVTISTQSSDSTVTSRTGRSGKPARSRQQVPGRDSKQGSNLALPTPDVNGNDSTTCDSTVSITMQTAGLNLHAAEFIPAGGPTLYEPASPAEESDSEPVLPVTDGKEALPEVNIPLRICNTPIKSRGRVATIAAAIEARLKITHSGGSVHITSSRLFEHFEIHHGYWACSLVIQDHEVPVLLPMHGL